MTNSTITTCATNHIEQPLGFISLVGAGPGDPELLTVKAYRRIQQADVVIYDRLVSKQIMGLVNPDAELVYVGKKLDHHMVPQEQINELLIEHGNRGKKVVRLKGGDPFIFGRGGEELETIAQHNIAFEVVPGITAASGCAAYAGIPLTHRDHAQSVQFITGHLKAHGEDIDWSSLAHTNHTLVFYMGLKQSPNIASNLINNGLPKQTPCAIVQQGATLEQKVFTGQIDQLEALAKQAKSPALIIIGSVTTLHQQLSWFDPTIDTSQK